MVCIWYMSMVGVDTYCDEWHVHDTSSYIHLDSGHLHMKCNGVNIFLAARCSLLIP